MRCLQIPRFIRGALVALMLPCSPAHADVVADWNEIALTTIASPDRDPAYVAHALATVHVAMFEVMNFIEGAYAAAAHYVLRELRPDRGGRHLGANIYAIRSADAGGPGARAPRIEARNAASVANITAMALTGPSHAITS